jgi:hypothetical protein
MQSTSLKADNLGLWSIVAVLFFGDFRLANLPAFWYDLPAPARKRSGGVG